jgi:lipopolysaccharide export system permease protein
MFLLLMQFLWRYIDELVGKGLGIEIIGEFLLYASAGLVPLALPLAVLLSSLMTFGNMGEYYELTAIKASGISLQRILTPVVILVIFISFAAFFFANNVVPITNLKMRTLRLDVRNLHPEVSITEGVFNKGIEHLIIRVGRKDPVTNLLYDIKVYDHSKSRGNRDVTVADSGRLKITEDKRNMIITLWDGYKYTEVDEGRRRRDRRFPHQLLKFGEQNIIMEMTGFELERSDERIFKNAYQMLNVNQLRNATDSLSRTLEMNSRDFARSLVSTSFYKLNNKQFTGSPEFNQRMYTNAGRNIDRPSLMPEERKAMIERNIAAQKNAARRAASRARADLPKDTTIRDTVITQTFKNVGLKKVENFDTLYSSFDIDVRKRIISEAINTVKTNDYMVETSTRMMDFEIRKLRKHQIELHRKFTLSFACLIFLFIGAPLGAIIRKGGLGLPTVISTLLFILYYVISLIGQKFVEESLLSAFQGMWLSSFILIVAGVFLTYQATNDSAILNIDTYLNWIREKTGLRKGFLLEKKSHIVGKFELIDLPKNELQKGFIEISNMAGQCIEQLKTDDNLVKLIGKSLHNTGYYYLVEFGVHYNSFVDQVILSKWFRIPYFEKRLTEFPPINGRITSTVFIKPSLRWIALIIFPVGVIRLIHLKLKVNRLNRNLKQVIDLSAGMVNLLNSNALKPEAFSPQ